MAQALVVYESMYGDAEQVAEAIAAGLNDSVPTECVEVGRAPQAVPAGVTLLVVGSPNHGTALPRPESRREAAAKTDRPLVSQGPGIREWLAALPAGDGSVAAATFDTRMTHPKMVTRFDHAAKSAAKALAKAGYRIAADSEPFFVEDVQGPLATGEVDRARAWGERLAQVAGS